MNHDYAHCLDFSKDCPKECFRAQLTMDLKRRIDLGGIPLTWMHFKGTEECKMREVATPPECEGDCGWCKTSVIEKCKGMTE